MPLSIRRYDRGRASRLQRGLHRFQIGKLTFKPLAERGTPLSQEACQGHESSVPFTMHGLARANLDVCKWKGRVEHKARCRGFMSYHSADATMRFIESTRS